MQVFKALVKLQCEERESGVVDNGLQQREMLLD